MNIVITTILMLLAFGLGINCFAQNTKMNRISLESGSVIGGVVGIAYERRIIKQLAVFGGVSALIDSNDEPFGFGIGIRLIPKEDIAGFILSLSYGTGSLSVEGGGVEGRNYLKGFIILGGYRFNIKEIIDIELGVGYERTNEKANVGILTTGTGQAIALNLGIGYHF